VIDDLSNGSLDNLHNVWNQIKFIEMDISTPYYQAYPRNKRPGVIFHLACFPRSMSFNNPTRDVEVNVNGMVNTLELARRTGAKVIFSSNSGIYDTSRIPIDEEAEDTPKTPYSSGSPRSTDPGNEPAPIGSPW